MQILHGRSGRARCAALSGFTLAIVLLTAACERDEEPKLPLGHPPIAGEQGMQPMQPTITGEARVALDSANALFRLRDYQGALAQYQRSAQLAPAEIAPLLGTMMVADAINDARLRQATMARIRAIDPTYDTTAVDGHSRVMQMHDQPGGAAKQ
jgi:hypothetical protein